MITKLAAVCGAILLIAVHPGTGSAQNGEDLKALQKEVRELKERQEKTERELESIKDFLQRRGKGNPSRRVVLDVGNNPSKGRKDAKVSLLDFSDYQ